MNSHDPQDPRPPRMTLQDAFYWKQFGLSPGWSGRDLLTGFLILFAVLVFVIMVLFRWHLDAYHGGGRFDPALSSAYPEPALEGPGGSGRVTTPDWLMPLEGSDPDLPEVIDPAVAPAISNEEAAQ